MEKKLKPESKSDPKPELKPELKINQKPKTDIFKRFGMMKSSQEFEKMFG